MKSSWDFSGGGKMVSKDVNNVDKAAAHSRRWDSHSCSYQSQWLQSTLSELDKKTQDILAIIQEDADSLAKKAEMFYRRRPELIKMVEDFHRSYHSLAEKYDQMRSESIQVANSRSLSTSKSIKQAQNLQQSDKPEPKNTKPEAKNSHTESVVEDSEFESETSNFSSDFLDELMATDHSENPEMGSEINIDFDRGLNKKSAIQSDDSMGGGLQMDSLEREKMWNELRLKVSKLIEENLRQQDQLIRRNDEKREAIKDQCFQINRLMDENRELKSLLSSYKVDRQRNQTPKSKLKGLFKGKFSG